MEYMVWKHKESEPRNSLERLVLRPRLEEFMHNLSPSQEDLLHKKITERVEGLTRRVRQKYEHMKASLDHRGVFHPNANAQRVHTLMLAELQKHLDIQRFEDEALEEMLNECNNAEPVTSEQQKKMASALQGTAFDALVTGSIDSTAELSGVDELANGISRNSLSPGATHLPGGMRPAASKAKAAEDARAKALGSRLGGAVPLKIARGSQQLEGGGATSVSDYTQASPNTKQQWATSADLHDGKGARFVADVDAFKTAQNGAQESSGAVLSEMVRHDTGFRDFMRAHPTDAKAKHKQFGSTTSGHGKQALPQTPALKPYFHDDPQEKLSLVGANVHKRAVKGWRSSMNAAEVESEGQASSISFRHQFLSEEDDDAESETSSVSSAVDQRTHDKNESRQDGGDDPATDKKATRHTGRRKEPKQKTLPGIDRSGSSKPVGMFRSRDGDGDQLASLQPRLNLVWFSLSVPMLTKLDFLQKYASVEYAPLLQEALLVWETCGLLIPLRERTLELIKRVTRTKERLELRELFTGAQQKVLMANNCWVPPDGGLEDEDNEPDREATDAWLGSVLRLLTDKCSDALALAESKFGDHITYRGNDYAKSLVAKQPAAKPAVHAAVDPAP